VVTPSDPCGGVWGGQESIDLLLGKEFHDPAIEALAWDREDSLAEFRVGRIRECDVAEEGVQRGQAGVAAAGTVAALAFQVIEELTDESGVKVSEYKTGGGAAKAIGGEAQQQAEGVAVGGHRVGACPPLLEEALGEERL
jgi:hypothetical protein